MWTRRDTLRILTSGAVVAGVSPASSGWTAEWDKALLEATLPAMERQFDSAHSMLTTRVGSGYNYHSALRNTAVHPTRESLHYALLLLEARQDERAAAIIHKVASLQDVDPKSKWYGLWGYYAEEPPAKMAPADWNWADFNGATLLMIASRHGGRLPGELRQEIAESIRHAAASVRRRNVSMSYTNIAVQGTFVTLGAAQLLDDADLRAYATDRLRRLAAAIDETGSFAEYNSPTYVQVTIANLTRMRMMLKDEAVLALTARIHYRAWLHLARHWHAPTRQLCGPQSRCYSTDIGQPLWIQKALGGRLEFVPLSRLKDKVAEGEVAVLDFSCPADLQSAFLDPPKAHMHREIFLAGKPGVRPVAGASYLEPRFCLGSANRSDFWVQRRPLVAYWGNSTRPARFAQLRFLKDDYDFSSALFSSVQEKSYVLALVNFRTPGGDKHISLDPIKNGEFDASRFRLRLDLANLATEARTLSNGKPHFGNLKPRDRLSFDLDGLWLHVQIREVRFGTHTPRLSLGNEDHMSVLSLDLISAAEKLRWQQLGEAWIALTLCITDSEQYEEMGFHVSRSGTGVRLSWKTPVGELALAGATRPGPVEELDAAYEDRINGTPVAYQRLSDDLLIKPL